MNFRDRVQDIIAGQANPAADAFEGYAGLRPGRVLGNVPGEEPERAGECVSEDTFLELFKRRSEHQFFRGKKSPGGGPEPAHEFVETRPGSKPSEPPKAPVLIPPEMVRAAIEREVRSLAAMGRTGPDALRDAIELTRAKVRNSEALADHQVNSGNCHVCGEGNGEATSVIAVLTGRKGVVLHMHAGCHEAHRRVMTRKVEAVMDAAGYGAERG